MVDKIKLIFIGLISGILNGLFAVGSGLIIVLGLNKCLNLEQRKCQATSLISILPASIISLVVYFIKDNQVRDILLPIYICIGGTIGGLLGAMLLNKLSNKFLHKLIGCVMIFAAIRILIS